MTYTPDQVSFKLYDNTIYDGPLMLDIKTINEYFIPYDTYEAFKYCK